VLLGLLTVQTSKVHFNFQAHIHCCHNYVHFIQQITSNDRERHVFSFGKVFNVGAQKDNMRLQANLFLVLLLLPNEVSSPIQAVNSKNTNHVGTGSKYHAFKKKPQINTCTCMVKYHVPACITLHNYSSNSSAVADVIDHCL